MGRPMQQCFQETCPPTPTTYSATMRTPFADLLATAPQNVDFRFLRVRPPFLEVTEGGVPVLPHIRLDRALQFLIGDRLL